MDQLGELLASTYIIAVFNGSLTHLILFYDKIKEFLFYLTSRYDDWDFKRNLLKFTIFNANSKEVKGIIDAYPEILKRLSSDDANSIISFCSIHPIEYKRQIRKLIAFGSIGYYLDDASFEKYEKEVVDEIEKWLNDDHSVVNVGQYIFESLSGVSHRMSQDVLSEICCKFMDKQYSLWYIEMFKFMSKRMDLNKMSKGNAESLVAHIIAVLKNEKEDGQIKYATSFLSLFRRQNKGLTEELDKQISESLPNFYNFYCKLETTDSKEQDYRAFVEKLTAMVQRSNEKQGANGRYYGHGTRDIASVNSILQASDFNYSTEIMDQLISTVADTLIKSKEPVIIKLDVVMLLCYIAIKYPQDYLRNLKVYNNIAQYESEIGVSSDPILFSNINSLALKIGFKMLFSTMGLDVYADLMELLPFIMNDTATTISVTKFIADYLDIDESFIIQSATESVLFHNTFEWLLMDSTDIRWNATRILLSLSRNKNNADIINRKIIALIESDNVYIRNLILREVNESHTISKEIKKRIFSICKDDVNYVTRMVCKELNPSTKSEDS